MADNRSRRTTGPRWFMGLMSGTSLDGVDAALVQLAGAGPELTLRAVKHYEVRWPQKLSHRLLSVMNAGASSAGEIARLNMESAMFFAEAGIQTLKKFGVAAQSITAVGSHGQTVYHEPPRRGGYGCTLQLGDAAVVAQHLRITVVGNFRAADMALGGQGAPLVPWADAMLLRHGLRDRCVQNIGGIGNVTWLPAGASRHDMATVRAFDTGPGNLVLDNLMELLSGGRKHFDMDGKLAASGSVDERLLRQLLRHKFFSKRPPKSTGREEFGRAFAMKMLSYRQEIRVADLLATATELTARSIAEAYKRYLPQLPGEVILCGGGADNPELVRRLKANLRVVGCDAIISRVDDFGIPNKAKEALSFAVLAAATIDGVAAGMPAVTGVRRACTLGVIARP